MLRRGFALWCLSPSVAARAANVKFTDRAWNRVAAVNAEENKPGRHLRMEIASGGCHGFTYKFAFEDAPADATAGDVVFVNTAATADTPAAVPEAAKQKHEARIVIDEASLEKLQGATIDYHSELKGSAFVVVGNELVDASCSCGMSISLRASKAA